MRNIFIAGLLLILHCTSCRLGPDYASPIVPVDSDWKNATEENANDELAWKNEPEAVPIPPCTDRWWQVFQDDTLDYLEETAINNSPNLLIALDRVAAARAIAGVDRSFLYPQLTLNPSVSDQKEYFHVHFSRDSNLPLPIKIPGNFRLHQEEYQIPLNLNYELDLWGRLTGQYESDVYNAQAQLEDFYNSLLTLTGDVANSYFTLRTLSLQIRIYEQNLELLAKNLNLVQTRYDKGLINYLDVITARQTFSDTQAAYFEVLRQKAIQEDVLATLVGTAASSFNLYVAPLQGIPPSIPLGTPANILLHRPDLAAAERQAAAQHSLIGSAYASFFPAIQLTGAVAANGGAFAFRGADFKAFFTWQSRLWSLAANMAQSVFDAGRNLSNLRLAYANFNQASHEYQQLVLQAFQEVEDALANIKFQEKSYGSYQESVAASLARTKLSTTRYEKGLNTYLEVIDSERTQLQAELNLANVLGERYLSTIQLIKALGGSWESFQTTLEEPSRSSQSECCDDSHGPDV